MITRWTAARARALPLALPAALPTAASTVHDSGTIQVAGRLVPRVEIEHTDSVLRAAGHRGPIHFRAP